MYNDREVRLSDHPVFFLVLLLWISLVTAGSYLEGKLPSTITTSFTMIACGFASLVVALAENTVYYSAFLIGALLWFYAVYCIVDKTRFAFVTMWRAVLYAIAVSFDVSRSLLRSISELYEACAETIREEHRTFDQIVRWERVPLCDESKRRTKEERCESLQEDTKLTRMHSEKDSCNICFENVKRRVAVPCGHYYACNSCSEIVKNKCPMCREHIDCYVTLRH